MLIIGAACVLGHQLNKDGKQGRSSGQPIVVSPNRIPSGTVIYDGNRVVDVDNYVRNLAAAKHAEKVRQMYPYDYDKPVNIFPNDLQGDAPAQLYDLGGLGDNSAKVHFDNSVKQAAAKNVNITAYDPSSGKPYVATAGNIDASPMFRSNQLAAAAPTGYTEFGGPVSLLTGKPLDMTHANMNPNFGKMVRQPGVSNENSQVLLEMYTGIPSSEDQGTYSTKREVENPFPNNPDNLQRANMTQVKDFYQRVAAGVKPSHEYKTPVKSFRDLPMKETTRVMPLSIDQTRGVNHKHVTYEGVMIPGQKGSTRPMMMKMRSNPWDLTTETKAGDLLPGRSTMQGSASIVVPNVRNNLATTVTESKYLAPGHNWKKVTDVGGLADMYKAQMDAQVSNRLDPYDPGFGVASGRQRSPNTGVFIMKDPEKGFANERQGQPYQPGAPALRNVSAPDATLKELFTDSTVGPINPNGRKDNNAWKKQDINVPLTSKAMNADNPYQGLPSMNLGMGNRKVSFQPWVTGKEMNEFSQQGNPKGLIPAHMSYDAVFEMDTDRTVEGERFGVAKGMVSKQVSDGGEIDVDAEKLMVTDYMMAPKGSAMGRSRKMFADGTELTYDRVDFGGYYNSAKFGNGEDAKRTGEVQIKEEMVVEGRMNPTLRRDNPNDKLEMEANLRPEKETVERRMVQKTQPKAVTFEQVPMLTRQKNSEVINPRLDINTKVTLTSDPYPWIKNKGTPEDFEDGET